MEMSNEQKVYSNIVQKAWDSTEFKRKLLKNPVATVEEFMGAKINLPQGQGFVVVDQSDEGTVYLNIPRDRRSQLLTDEQLEIISGGGDIPYDWSSSDLIYSCFKNATIWVRNTF